MIDPTGEYQQAVNDVEQAYKVGIRAFAAWFAKNWKVTADEWKRDYANPLPNGDWFDGHNAGVESATDAVEVFLGEFHP